MMQFSGSVFGNIAFTVANTHCGISDRDLPALLVQRRAKWQPATQHSAVSARTARSSLNQLGITWPADLPLQTALAQIHVNWVYDAVLDRLEKSTHVQVVGDLRYVEVLGLYGVVIQQASSTVLHSYSLRVCTDDPRQLISDATPVSLARAESGGSAVAPWIIPLPQWMLAVVRQLLAGYGDAAQARAFASDTTLAEMISHAIQADLLGWTCSREWTESIAKAFVLDDLVQRFAPIMYGFAPSDGLPCNLKAPEPEHRRTLTDYETVLLQERHIVSKLLQEQSNLLNPYLALRTCFEHDGKQEPVQWVKQRLCELGSTQRVWRSILKSDGRLLTAPIRQFGHPLLALTWVIALIERCETSDPVSPRLVRALAPLATWASQHRISPFRLIEKYSGLDNPQRFARQDTIVLAARPLWRHLNDQFKDKGDPQGVYPPKAFLRQIEELHDWLLIEGDQAAQRIGKRSWDQLIHKMNQETRRRYSFLLDLPDWWVADSPIDQIDDEFRIVPLVNQHELACHGALMRNCMRDFLVEDKGDRQMYLCAFAKERDRPIAMIELVKTETTWRLAQIAGPANRDIASKSRKRIVKAAKHVAEQMRRVNSSSLVPSTADQVPMDS